MFFKQMIFFFPLKTLHYKEIYPGIFYIREYMHPHVFVSVSSFMLNSFTYILFYFFYVISSRKYVFFLILYLLIQAYSFFPTCSFMLYLF